MNIVGRRGARKQAPARGHDSDVSAFETCKLPTRELILDAAIHLPSPGKNDG